MATSGMDAFIERWSKAGGGEMSNSQSYLSELCDVLGVERPHPFTSDTSKHDYVFERRVEREWPDGTKHTLRIDLYRRGCFVLESKQGASPKVPEPVFTLTAPAPEKKGIGTRGTDTWRAAMVRAKAQAEGYARDLPADHGWPPFVVVVDVGYCIELWANFARDGKAYTQFPDRNRFRIFHRDEDAHGAPTVRDPDVQARLKTVWLDPLSLDPSKHAAKVTREVAGKLALLAKALENKRIVDGKEVCDLDGETVAMFLMRCLFCMFAEDVGLLPKDGFRDLLVSMKGHVQQFVPLVTGLWREMDQGTPFSTVLRAPLRQFNGGLFRKQEALPVTDAQLDLLIAAADTIWSDVEPAIFGTLLERALDSKERHKLGAHYTPRSYVERLVLPTVIEPLRADWLAAQKEAQVYELAGRREAAIDRLVTFHQELCKVRVLDPACGSANFLYVTLEHMKRLEGEVLQAIADYRANGKAGQLSVKEGTGEAVHPRQFRGIEVNPRAAVIAEMVLWIGYLQWQSRTLAVGQDEELRRKLEAKAVLEDLHNIENRDAVLAWDVRRIRVGEDGRPVTVWDGVSTKTHPVTGLEVPDEAKRRAVEEFVGARKAVWPEVDFVVGNPPFIGNKRMRAALGDGYVEALRQAHGDVPDTVDFVMYWWHCAAELLKGGGLRRFGFITTNSITQTFNRQVIQQQLAGGLKLAFAVPDHPWVDTTDGAAVRVAMTVAVAEAATGRVLCVQEERSDDDGAIQVALRQQTGLIHADLRIGANVASAARLRANANICYQGYVLVGEGFVLSHGIAEAWVSEDPAIGTLLRPWRNGRDFSQEDSRRSVVDAFGLDVAQLRASFPKAYQHLLLHVKPQRDQVQRKNHRERWWIWGEARPGLRAVVAGLPRVIITNFAAKHRVFAFDSPSTAHDHNLYVIGSGNAVLLGVLSSRAHVTWMLAAGSTLENRPLWINSTCFLPFPFPAPTPDQESRIRDLGERLDAHRKRQQALHPTLTLTGMYNVLEKLRAGEALTDKDRTIHEQGLCSVLRQRHDELDAAVFDAYGWPVDLSDEELLQKLVDLNAERAAEEQRGLVRWLRPDFQDPARKGQAQKQGLDLGFEKEPDEEATTPKKAAWPSKLGERFAALDVVLAQAKAPMSVDEVAARFDGAQAAQVEALLRAVAGVGGAVEVGGKWVGLG